MEQLLDNRYRIVRPLGSGGMAEVYLAHDDVLDRDVALKVMSRRYADDEEFVERFKREAQSAAALSHPNIVSIYDRGESEDGTYYIAMEFLPGGTLKDCMLRRGPLQSRTAAEVALQIAEALQAAHGAGVVHRDIKPHNVLVTATGDVKVGDFGIARAASSSTMTKTGSILGTAHYISPEQAMGEPVGPQSDLYSLGVVLYEMLTGTLPYDAETPIGIAIKHVNSYLIPPREVNPEVPEGINAIVVKLLAKNPHERYADAAELIEDLERVIAGLDPANTTTQLMNHFVPTAGTARTRVVPPMPIAPSRMRRGDKQRRKRRLWAPILLILLLLALLGAATYALGPGTTTSQQQIAVTKVPNLVGASSIEEAQEWAGEDFVVVEGESVESKEAVGTIVAQTPEAGGEVEPRLTIYVSVSGTQISDLPNVEGETRDDAMRILEEAGFQVEVQTKESPAKEEGYVTAQDPQGGESETAEVGSSVEITVGSGLAPVKVPDLSNRTPDEARRILKEANLSLGNRTEASNDRVPSGQIVDQRPAAGTEVKPDGTVDITVSSGPKQIEVPDVVGSDVEKAKQAVWSAGFGYEVQRVQSSQPIGTVISTNPPGGTSLDPHSGNVIIKVSEGPPPQQQQQQQPAPRQTDSSTSSGSNRADDGGSSVTYTYTIPYVDKSKDDSKSKEDAKSKGDSRDKGGGK